MKKPSHLVVKCVDKDQIHVKVKDLPLRQGQGQNLSLMCGLIVPVFSWDNLFHVMVFSSKEKP